MSNYMLPSIGRIVHYIAKSGQHWPAMITAVQSMQGMNINLQIFPDTFGMVYKQNVQFDAGRGKHETWHWPESVAEDRYKASLQVPDESGEDKGKL